ncbi:MAG TPA: hypothetical protein VLI94_06465 [Solirubrobacterales bacterium]|nr:hypothetical protein [Solirubrobacterales bacterium]
MIVALVALMLAMVGTGYAAVNLPKKSVGTAQLKGKAVTNAKIKNGTITGKKLKLKTIGTVPNATHAAVADLANSIPPSAVHVVGAPGEPGFQSGTTNFGTLSGIANTPGASFLKDRDNIVHLEGIVKKGAGGPIPGTLFQLPPGFRPPSGTIVVVEVPEEQQLLIVGSNVVVPGADLSGLVIAQGAEENVILTGLSFFAGS